MPRGKNYVNNNQGVFLQASKKNAQIMRQCEYGSACNRPDCIYRHDHVTAKSDGICLPFLAGMCAFAAGGCRKRHPTKDEKDRLLRKYKKMRCHFGDECHTEGCLYLHPREMRPVEPAYVEPANMDAAFPALGSAPSKATSTLKTERLPPSPWNNGQHQLVPQSMPMEEQQHMSNIPVAPTWFPQDPSFAPFSPPAAAVQQHNQQHIQQPYYAEGYDNYGGGYGYADANGGYNNNNYNGYDMGAQGGEMPAQPQMAPQSFNAGAKEFIPGGLSS